MKKVLSFMLVVLIVTGFGLYQRNQSSYKYFENLKSPSPTDYGNMAYTGEEDMIETDEKTLEDIALDKRFEEERKKNEKTYKEQGISGTTIRPLKKEPSFSIDEYTKIFHTIYKYMEENTDKFPEPTDDILIRRTPDPRINERIYSDDRNGIVKDYEMKNLIALELKKLDGEYTIIILGREDANVDWIVLAEGDVYTLREEI